ncbi:hypothetical protein AAHB37_17675 [Glutamicibacter halophytocola]
MPDKLDLEAQWPELFTQLDTKKRRAVVQSFSRRVARRLEAQPRRR